LEVLQVNKLLVLDIDQTLVDSSIRENECCSSDVLDLDKYLSLKREGIVYDTLLPLGEWIEANAAKYDFLLCTARQFEYIDFESLYSLMPNTMNNALQIMCRNNSLDYGGNTCESSDKYKRPLLTWVKANYNRELVVIDDCPKVLQVARESGHKAVCARDLWHLSESDIKRRLENALY
jgi:hypothetical protein